MTSANHDSVAPTLRVCGASVNGSPRMSLVLVALLLVIASFPSTAAAQKDQFFDALLPLYNALGGIYGDEGPRLTAQVEAMSAALSRWDAANRDAEAMLRARLTGADVPTALQVHTLLGSMALERGQFTTALREFNDDVRLDPQRAAFHRFRALLFEALNRPAEAADAFRAAWLANPADPQNAYQLLVHVSLRKSAAERRAAHDTLAALERQLVSGQAAKANAPFLSIRPIADETGGAMAFAPAAYATAITLLLTGQLEAGMTALRAAVAADPLVADPALRGDAAARGIAALRQGQVNQAIQSFQAAVTQAPDSSDVHRLLATAQIVNGDVSDGIEQLRDAVGVNPKNERAWLALARALDESGDEVEAANVLRTAIGELPDAGELRWQHSVISGKRQRTDNADLALVDAADRLVLLAGAGELQTRVARLAQTHLDYDRAIALLERAALLTPNDSNVHQALGRAYVDQGRDEEGYAELVVSLWLDPADAGTLTAIGSVHLAEGRYQDGIAALTRAVSLDAANPQSAQALGEALVRAGQIADGQQRLAEAARLQARAVETQRRERTIGMLSLQGELHMTERNFDAAVDAWQQLIALENRSAVGHMRLADALAASNRLEPAAAELQVAISLDADPDAHRRLAAVYAELGRADDSAREHRAYVDLKLQELHQRSRETP